MEREFGKEIDELRNEVRSITDFIQTVWGATANVPAPADAEEMGKHLEKMGKMHPDPLVNEMMCRLQDRCEKKKSVGEIVYMGVFASGGRQSNWIRNGVDADDLLSLAEKGDVEKVLACIGNADRMRLLLSILRQPQTVAEMVEHGFSSTGQVYNLLKPLIAANLVQENQGKRGQYHVVPHRVQGIVMLLAGISDLLDPTYTKGQW